LDNSKDALLQISQVLNVPLALSFLMPRVAQSANARLNVANEATVSGRWK
jgi:hypothetical protein